MSGSADDASFLHNNHILFTPHVPASPFQTDDTTYTDGARVWPPSSNVEPFQDLPVHHFLQMNEVISRPNFDATAPKHNNGSETPSSDVVFGVSERIGDPDADFGATNQMPKKRKVTNAKQVSSGRNNAKKLKACKLENESEYVHVRARRGQATDSHSLAERARREKIGERMKRLQSLVPGCDKIAGKAQVLDEIINYVQSLQTQVQMLVGKLSILSPNLSCYDINQGTVPHARTQGVDVPLWEKDLQGHLYALDHFWMDYLVQSE